jgi:hypothetical protein
MVRSDVKRIAVIGFIVLQGLLGLLFAAHTTYALVVCDPFVGTLQEDFNSQPLLAYMPSLTVMDGEITLTSETYFVGIRHSWWGFGNKGSMYNDLATWPGDPYGFGNDTTSVPFSFVFTTPVIQFGGEWNSGIIGSHITFTFYDDLGSLIGTDVWLTPTNAVLHSPLNWHGWSSTEGIKRIDVTESVATVFDNLQVVIPEPTTWKLTVIGSLAVLGLLVGVSDSRRGCDKRRCARHMGHGRWSHQRGAVSP